MKHNLIENDFTDEANIKILGHKIALTLRSPVTTLCTVTFNIQEFYFYMQLRTNCHYFPVKNQPIGLWNRGMCFLRRTNCLFLQLMLIFKEIILQYVVSTQTASRQSLLILWNRNFPSQQFFFSNLNNPSVALGYQEENGIWALLVIAVKTTRK